MKPTLFLIFLSITSLLFAQDPPPTERIVTIEISENADGSDQFVANTPPLNQMAGAKEAFWTYYWEFGDGNFSFEESPAHLYTTPGDHDVGVWATGNYDNGKPPPSKPKTRTKGGSSAGGYALVAQTVLTEAEPTIRLKSNRNPSPKEEMVCILSYANEFQESKSGYIHLYFNEKRFQNDHFEFKEARTHFGESSSDDNGSIGYQANNEVEHWASNNPLAIHPDIHIAENEKVLKEMALEQARETFKSKKVWRYENMEADEKRNLFISLNSTDQMVKDTSVFIYVRAILIPDNHWEATVYDMDIEIVASHDPNVIAVSDKRTSFRGIQKKKLDYKVRFQNNGEGPASKVEVTCDVPDYLDIEEVEIIDQYPECPICPNDSVEYSCIDTLIKDQQAIFTFRNIYLPGSNQDGINDIDSTKGFVKYRLRPGKKIKKRPFKSQAKIVFDKNDPIYTNFTKTSFKPGLSPGVKFAWNHFPDSTDLNYATLGLTLGPYKPYRLSYQLEFFLGVNPEKENTSIILNEIDRDTFSMPPEATLRTITDSIIRFSANRNIQFSFVPISLRKNIIDFLGVGVGAMVNLRLSESRKKEDIYNKLKFENCIINEETGELVECIITSIEESFTEGDLMTENNTDVLIGLFADLELGLVRAGPYANIRGILWPGKNPNFGIQAGVGWRF